MLLLSINTKIMQPNKQKKIWKRERSAAHMYAPIETSSLTVNYIKVDAEGAQKNVA